MTPPLGLLLDVDGPVAAPATRTVAPALLADLAALLDAGIPVVLNTGRSIDFVREHVLGPLVAGGLPDRARLHAVCEKGGAWTTARPTGVDDAGLDLSLRVPEACSSLLAELAGSYRDALFVDGTKQVMATVEARSDVPPAHYRERQRAFDAELLAGLTAAGLGVQLGEERVPDDAGRTPWRIDPSVIATDVEASVSGKALGARRALELLADDGPLPTAWHTVGDSRSDYAMADQLHELGHAVTHVDVAPLPPLRDRPYPVVTVPGLADADAGAAHLRSVLAGLPR
ncbi:hypothetical protein DQ244_11825 [Blastococcus sp. TBT05-19]|uniref:hypothetical protein n=1 Tax=Blastococcus sp. TBT05-19 TaxID=2250581 RepID=UPI000DEAE409|nr:hypothetical protein [Blastococcus sp. TBT05-19]RBY90154.1 hypothetical protein DQ244_11825 [Blastococcus sp. TBT05-19]